MSVNHLDCPICMEQYDEGLHTPKMMPCLHTMCASCIATLVASLDTAPPLPARQQPQPPPYLPEPVAEEPVAESTIYEEPVSESQPRQSSNPRIPNTEVISAVANILQRHRGHPVLRRIAGRSPVTSPTSPLSSRASPFSPAASSLPSSTHSSSVSSSSSSSAEPIYAVSGPSSAQSLPMRNPNDPLPTPPTQQSASQRPVAAPPPPPVTPATQSNSQSTPDHPSPPPTRSTQPNPPPTLPARPANLRNTGAICAQPQRRVISGPQVRKVSPNEVTPNEQSKELVIQRDKVIQCPLCRSKVNTSNLQTNRYVLAHLKDLALLKVLATQQPPERKTPPTPTSLPTAPVFTPTDYWCVSCDAPAHLDCSPHQLSPLTQWVETLKASAVELDEQVKRDLALFYSDLDSTENDMKTVVHTLKKAYVHLLETKQDVCKLVEELKELPGEMVRGGSPLEQEQAVSSRVTKLRQLQERFRHLESGSESSEVYVYRQANKLYVSTSQPDTTLIITINKGHAIDV